MSKRGKPLRGSLRRIVYNVIQFCEKEKNSKCTSIDLNKVNERVEAMTGLSKRTISRIKKEGATNNGVWTTPGKHRKERQKKIILDESLKIAIRRLINEFPTVRKEKPTLRKLHEVLKENINFCGGLTSLRTVLKQLGYNNAQKAKKESINKHQSENDKIEIREQL